MRPGGCRGQCGALARGHVVESGKVLALQIGGYRGFHAALIAAFGFPEASMAAKRADLSSVMVI
ncbi:hypothetical protein ACTJKE_13155 [Ensifer sp. 22521]|jgi:hypothetical protein|uniref:hypothetical protein n=1 Tax=Ensifer sp. 22521 TaxID=3453935 RepID=UPI003F8799A7